MSQYENACENYEKCPGFEDFTKSIEFFELKIEMLKKTFKKSQITDRLEKIDKILNAKTIPELETLK